MNIGKVSVKVNNTGLESVARTNGNDATVKIMLVKGPKGDDGGGLPSGGTTGQVLAKHSNTSQDAEWKTLTASDVGALAADGTAVSATKTQASLLINDRNSNVSFNGSAARSLSFVQNLCTISSWSNTTDSDGFYTTTINLLPYKVRTKCPINCALKGSSTSNLPTDAQIAAYNLVDHVSYDDSVEYVSSLTMYAKTKPTTTFYVEISGTYFE